MNTPVITYVSYEAMRDTKGRYVTPKNKRRFVVVKRYAAHPDDSYVSGRFATMDAAEKHASELTRLAEAQALRRVATGEDGCLVLIADLRKGPPSEMLLARAANKLETMVGDSARLRGRIAVLEQAAKKETG